MVHIQVLCNLKWKGGIVSTGLFGFFFFSAEYCSHRNKTEQKRFFSLLGLYPVLVFLCLWTSALKYLNLKCFFYHLPFAWCYLLLSSLPELGSIQFWIFFLIRPVCSLYVLLEELVRKHMDRHLWVWGA